MRKLAIPQSYDPGSSDEEPGLRVIAVQPAGSAEAALQALVIAEPDCALGLAHLARAQPELAVALYRLIDELDGLAYRHPEQGLLPLTSEPLWPNLPAVWPDADADGAPDLDTVAEWLTWFGDDAQRWWGGLSVTTDRGHWQLGDQQPVRAIFTEATTCRITRQPDAPLVTQLILSRLPAATAEALRQAIAGVRAVHELEAPLFAAETRDLLQQAHGQLKAQLRLRLEPPPTSTQPSLPIVITHVLHPETPAEPNELTGDIQSHNAEVQSFVLLEPIAEAKASLDACVPRGSEARRLLAELALTAPEFGSLALRIADHLDGLARTGKAGLQPVPMAGIILYTALGELLRHPKDDPWELAATFYRGLWMAVGHHLARVWVETPAGGIWTSRRPLRLREVLAGQERCTIARSEQDNTSHGHACLNYPISSELSRRWLRQV